MADMQHLAHLGAPKSPVLDTNICLERLLALVQEQVSEQKRTNALIQDLLSSLRKQ
jgi:hypothetical protein